MNVFGYITGVPDEVVWMGSLDGQFSVSLAYKWLYEIVGIALKLVSGVGFGDCQLMRSESLWFGFPFIKLC